jgi:hypothetical protein
MVKIEQVNMLIERAYLAGQKSREKEIFTESEINLLLSLISDNEREGSYYGNKRIYWATRYKAKEKIKSLSLTKESK